MNRFQILLAAAAAMFALPAFAHDGVNITDAYARSTGASAAVFMQIENHADQADRLISVRSDAAAKVELHSHIVAADGVMQMRAVPEGIAIPAYGSHALVRGGDHVMMMGLTGKLVDGDVITIILTFEAAGEITVEVPVDNTRKPVPMAAMNGSDMPAN